MEQFIADLYDQPTLDIDRYADLIDKDTMVLRYSRVLADPRIKTSLAFSWMWQRFFGVVPSKVELYEYAMSPTPDPSSFKSIFDYITATTFARFVKQPYEQLAQSGWQAAFAAYMNKISQNPVACKAELTNKLLARFGMSIADIISEPSMSPEAAFYEKTLYMQYLEILARFASMHSIPPATTLQNGPAVVFKAERKRIHDASLENTNPFTNTKLRANTSRFVSRFECLTTLDAIRSVVLRDYSFMRAVFDKCGLIVCGPGLKGYTIDAFIESFKGIGSSGKAVVFSCLPDETAKELAPLKHNPHVFTSPFGDMRYVFACVPEVLRKVAVWKAPQEAVVAGKKWTFGHAGTACYVDKMPPVSTMPQEQPPICVQLLANAPPSLGSAKHLCLPMVPGFFMNNKQGHTAILQVIAKITVDPYRNPATVPMATMESLAFVNNEMMLRALVRGLDPATTVGAKQNHSAKNCVLVVDNRESILSVLACTITMDSLDNDAWNLVIMTSSHAAGFYKSMIGTDGSTEYTVMPCLEKTEFDLDDYNRLVKSRATWNMLAPRYKNCLIIQDDGMLVRKGIEQLFLDRFDYVGAPWDGNLSFNADLVKMANPQLVGNGGLSLRNIEWMLRCCPKEGESTELFNNDIQVVPEDVHFSRTIHALGGRIPTTADAAGFAMEEIFCLNSLGFHKMWGYLPFPQVYQYFMSLH